MKIVDAGAKPTFPKTLTCRNCGCEVIVDSLADLAHLAGFAWIEWGNVPVRGLKFACPNVCGSCYVINGLQELQAFYRAPCVSYGGDNIDSAGFGSRQLDPKRRRFIYRRRRRGGEHGSVQEPRDR